MEKIDIYRDYDWEDYLEDITNEIKVIVNDDSGLPNGEE